MYPRLLYTVGHDGVADVRGIRLMMHRVLSMHWDSPTLSRFHREKLS